MGPEEAVDQEEACSFLNKSPLHGLEGRGRGMASVEEEDKVPGRTQQALSVKALRQGNAKFPGPERAYPAARLCGGLKALGEACCPNRYSLEE